MPKGRQYKSPKEAKRDSMIAILKALNNYPEGMRFNTIRSETGFHQATVSARLKELISLGHVEYDPINRVYKISQSGFKDLETRKLFDIIEKSSRLVLGGKGAESLDSVEDLILKSTVSYSFPAIKSSSLGYLRKILHKYFLLHIIHEYSKNHVIDARFLTGEKPLNGLVEQLKDNLFSLKQVLAFKIDLMEVSRQLTEEYISEVIRIAKLEDAHGIQDSQSEAMKYQDLWVRYAEEEKVLEFIEENGRVSIFDVCDLLGVDEKMAESILDGLLGSSIPEGMRIFDEKGNLVKSITFGRGDFEVDLPGGSVVKLRVKTNSPFLVKSVTREGVYYSISVKETLER